MDSSLCKESMTMAVIKKEFRKTLEKIKDEPPAHICIIILLIVSRYVNYLIIRASNCSRGRLKLIDLQYLRWQRNFYVTATEETIRVTY